MVPNRATHHILLEKLLTFCISFQGHDKPVLHLSSLTEGTYVFNLKVTDSSGQSNKANVKVIVLPEVDTNPVAIAGDDKVYEQAQRSSKSMTVSDCLNSRLFQNSCFLSSISFQFRSIKMYQFLLELIHFSLKLFEVSIMWLETLGVEVPWQRETQHFCFVLLVGSVMNKNSKTENMNFCSWNPGSISQFYSQPLLHKKQSFLVTFTEEILNGKLHFWYNLSYQFLSTQLILCVGSTYWFILLL